MHAADFSCAPGEVACLIGAINAAKVNGAANTITLAAGLYTLTAVDNNTDGPTGLPSVTGPLTLRGAGAASTIIERAAGAPPFRLLHVAATGVLTLEGLTLQGGNLTGLPDGGGGVRNRGTLTIAHSLLRGHAASSGGGIYNTATLMITHSTVRGNVASGQGGGIFSLAPLTITHSTLSGNAASGQGGGVLGGTLTITDSTLHGNSSSGNGGGISLLGGSITNSTLSGNVAVQLGPIPTITSPAAK
jgi:hypothetical protein